MCTVSWRSDPGGYEVLFNRDELRSRAEALGPRLRTAQSTDPTRKSLSYLAPSDPDGGGTWILVNHVGLTVCLTNGYRPADSEQRADWRSRGLLVTDLAACRNQDEVARATERLIGDHRYRSFSLLAFATGNAPRGWSWADNGSELVPFEPLLPLSSSSLDPTGAGDLRRRLFAGLPAEPVTEDLLALHRSHQGGPRSLTPCMHRPEARTVSLTLVQVTPDSVMMQYAPGSPCRTPLTEPVVIRRRAGDFNAV